MSGAGLDDTTVEYFLGKLDLVPPGKKGGNLPSVYAEWRQRLQDWFDAGGSCREFVARHLMSEPAQARSLERAWCARHGEHDRCQVRELTLRSVEAGLGGPLVPASTAARMAAHRRQIEIGLRRFAPGDRIWPGEPS